MSRPPAPWTSFPARSCRLSLIVGGLGLVVTPASPVATAATTFQVTASVLKGCLITAPPTLGFGSYNPGVASPAVNTTQFSMTCTAGTPYSVGVSAGTGSGAPPGSRAMTSASAAASSNTLGYGLYKDPSYATSWDNSVSSSGYTGTGTPQPIDVFGRIPTRQFGAAPASDYSDTVTVTLSY